LIRGGALQEFKPQKKEATNPKKGALSLF